MSPKSKCPFNSIVVAGREVKVKNGTAWIKLRDGKTIQSFWKMGSSATEFSDKVSICMMAQGHPEGRTTPRPPPALERDQSLPQSQLPRSSVRRLHPSRPLMPQTLPVSCPAGLVATVQELRCNVSSAWRHAQSLFDAGWRIVHASAQ